MKKFNKFDYLIITLESILFVLTIIYIVLNKSDNKLFMNWFAFNLSLNILGPLIYGIYIAVREYKDKEYSMKTYTGLVLGLDVMFGIGISLVIDHLGLGEKTKYLVYFYIISSFVFLISYIIGVIFEKKANESDTKSKIKVNNKRG